jgi:hypothetical protein
MTEQDYQSWPADRVQGPLRRDEALKEMVRAERVLFASRRHPDKRAKPDASADRSRLGLKAGKGPK